MGLAAAVDGDAALHPGTEGLGQIQKILNGAEMDVRGGIPALVERYTRL